METVIFGGSGFVGRSLARRLVESGHHVIIPTRDRERAKEELIVLPNTDVVGCDPVSPRAIDTLVEQADVVVNLVGMLHESSRNTFEQIHVDFVRRLADAAGRSRKLRQLIHVSAINATPGAPSTYLRSKGKGEALVSKLLATKWTTVRPSLLFGEGSGFLRMVEWQVARLPVIGIPCAEALFQPLHVSDFARMLEACILNPDCYGKTLTAGGPARMSLREIYGKVQSAMGRKRLLFALPRPFAILLASGLSLVPFLPPLLTRSDIASMSVPSVCEGGNDAEQLVGKLMSFDDFLRARHEERRNARSVEFRRFRHNARRG